MDPHSEVASADENNSVEENVAHAKRPFRAAVKAAFKSLLRVVSSVDCFQSVHSIKVHDVDL